MFGSFFWLRREKGGGTGLKWTEGGLWTKESLVVARFPRQKVQTRTVSKVVRYKELYFVQYVLSSQKLTLPLFPSGFLIGAATRAELNCGTEQSNQ